MRDIFDKLISLFKVHILVVLLALGIGVIYTAPFVYQAQTSEYKGVIMADASDADFYLTFINKSYGSLVPVGDPFQYEYRDLRNPFQFFLIEFVLGKLGSVLNLSISALHIDMQFVFPALLTLCVYAFVLALSESRPIALLASASLLLGNEIVRFSGFSDTLNTFLFQGSYREFLNYSRPVNPQVSFLFLLGALGALLALFRNPHSKRVIIVTGVLVGGLIYIYLYFWAFALTLLGVIFLYGFLTRKKGVLTGAFFAGLVALLTMAPFFVMNIPVFMGSSESSLTQAILTHKVIFEKMILAPLFLYLLIHLLVYTKKVQNKLGDWMRAFVDKYSFVTLLLFTGLIVSNQQVITGRMVFVEHFHFFTNIPIFLLSMSILGGEVLALFSGFLRFLGVGVAIVALAWFSLGVEVISYRAHREEAGRYQKLAPIISYLNESAPKQSVIMTNYFLCTRLTIYTPHFVYSAGGTDATFPVPRERVLHGYFTTLALRGVTADSVRAYVYEPANRKEIGSMIFVGTYWRDLCGSQGCFPDSVLEDLIPRYQAFASHPLLENIHKYKADYLLWDSKKEPSWRLRDIIEYPPVMESGDFKLYTLKPLI